MTIDEAIARERQQAKEQRNHIGTWDDEYSKKCEVYAEEHEQLAEWLEELKKIKSNGRYVQGNKAGQKIGYNKAIDDFVKLAKEHDFKHDKKDITNCVIGFIEFFAEQLKAGRENEQSI